jgi:hypothetical protein
LDQRIFHRYPAKIPVVYHVERQPARGTLINLSVGGAFVATEQLPTEGTELQIALLDAQGNPEMWLDAWVVRHTKVGGEASGFGAILKQAVARTDKEHLAQLLKTLFGVAQPTIRSMQPPQGGATVHVFRFPRLEPDDALKFSSGPTRSNTETRMQAIVKADDAWDDSLQEIALDEVEFVGSPRGIQVGHGELTPPPQDPKAEEVAQRKQHWNRIRDMARKVSRIGVGKEKNEHMDVDADVEPMGITYLWESNVHPGRVTAATGEHIVLKTHKAVPDIGTQIEVRLPLNTGSNPNGVFLLTRLARIKQDLPYSYLVLEIERIDESDNLGVYGLVTELFKGFEVP